MLYLWEWFAELNRRRTNGGLAPNPITFSDIESWARLTGREPTPWEVSVLTRLDDALLAAPKDGKPMQMANAKDGAAVSALLANFKKA